MALLGMSPWAFLKTLGKRISDNAVTDRAATLAYYFVFALFPFLFTMVTLAAFLPVHDATQGLVDRLDPLMPDEAMGIIRTQLNALITQQRPRLLTFGLFLAIWSASRGVDGLRTALNLSYDVKESRPWWRVQVMANAITVATSALMLLAIAGLAAGSGAGLWLAAKLHVDQFWILIWGWLRWPITAAGVMLVLALLYYFLPDVKEIGFHVFRKFPRLALQGQLRLHCGACRDSLDQIFQGGGQRFLFQRQWTQRLHRS